jgi:hypothetical protein
LNGFANSDIDANGRIVVSAGIGSSTILLTDESLASFSTFDAGTLQFNKFVAFVERPLGLAVREPGSVWLLGLAMAGLIARVWKQHRQKMPAG